MALRVLGEAHKIIKNLQLLILIESVIIHSNCFAPNTMYAMTSIEDIRRRKNVENKTHKQLISFLKPKQMLDNITYDHVCL